MTRRREMLTAYARAWTRPQEDLIRADLQSCWTAKSTYVNPLTDVVEGIDGLTRLILDYPVLFPDHALQLTDTPVVHADSARLPWSLTSTAPIRLLGTHYGHRLNGMDYLRFDRADRIQHVIAFFDRPQVPLHPPTRTSRRPG